MSIFKAPSLLILVIFAALSANAAAQDAVSPECRGVAAGVVAAMRAAGEVNGPGASEAAVIAARRACTAAREDLGTAPLSAASTAEEQTPKKEKFSVWDLLSSDQNSKPGNERLKRLRQQ